MLLWQRGEFGCLLWRGVAYFVLHVRHHKNVYEIIIKLCKRIPLINGHASKRTQVAVANTAVKCTAQSTDIYT